MKWIIYCLNVKFSSFETARGIIQIMDLPIIKAVFGSNLI